MSSHYSTHVMPKEWSLSMITPIYKKGDKKECKNYRGISVLNAAYKILSSILCERLKSYLQNIIGEYQCGFRPGKSTSDYIFTLRQILNIIGSSKSTHTICSWILNCNESVGRAEETYPK